jgi:hypothetical protein
MEYYGQNLKFWDMIVCNEHLGKRLNGGFKARMNFLIVLGTLILKIPLGILKKADVQDGLMPVFCATGMNVVCMKLRD